MEILPTLFLYFFVIYLMAYFRVFRNWDPKHRVEASSYFISLTHGTPKLHLPSRKVFDILYLLFYAFYVVVKGIIGLFFVYKMGVFT
ncbi:hypothetical protein GQ457_03G023810 [Hibiscus cannabinus]